MYLNPTQSNIKVIFIVVFIFLGLMMIYVFVIYDDTDVDISQTQNIANNTTTKIVVLNPPELNPTDNESETTGKISSFLSKPIIANISK